jgi:hypothetical protein
MSATVKLGWDAPQGEGKTRPKPYVQVGSLGLVKIYRI